MVALPIVGSDNNIWGTELNTFLSVGHNADGTPKTEQLALADASDVTLTTPAANHELIRDSTHWFNILHRYRPQAYVGFTGDGVTDDSTPITNMLNDLLSAGRGHVEFPNKVIAVKNMPIYPRAVIDFNGAELQLHSSGTNSDDVIRSNNFNTYTGTTTDVAGGEPWGFDLMNGYVRTPTANTGRHTVAIYAASYRLHNLHIMHSGIGSGLWTEGNGPVEWSVNQPNQWPAGKSLIFSDISILDGVSTSGVSTAPSTNDMSLTVTNAVLSGGNTVMTVTTARPHFVNSSNHLVTFASIGGITGASGNFTVTGTPTSSSVTVSGSFGGAYTSGGTLSYHVSAAWTHLGPSDCQASNIFAFATTNVAARRGVLFGANNAGATSASGSDIENIHVYDNFSMGGDFRAGAVQINGGQFEGSVKCCLLIRDNGRNQYNGIIFGGFGGATLFSQRDSNQNIINANLCEGGSGSAPASGFNNVYWENYNCSNMGGTMQMQHDFNTNAKAASGQAPTSTYMQAFMNAFGISSATLSSDFGTAISSTTWGYAAFPTGLTWVGT